MDSRRIRRPSARTTESSCPPMKAWGRLATSITGIPVPRKLAAELTSASKLQAGLFLRPNDDGLFPGFSQTWQPEG